MKHAPTRRTEMFTTAEDMQPSERPRLALGNGRLRFGADRSQVA
jgi:hypothetical protein